MWRHSYIEVRGDKIRTSYTGGGELTFSNLTTPHEGKPAVGFNYVYTIGFFVKIINDAFPEDQPYLFTITPQKRVPP
jgi:hypothetical protein